MKRLGIGNSGIAIMVGLLSMSISSCSTSGDDVFAEFETRSQKESSDSTRDDSSVAGIIFNLGDTVMEYEVEELNVNL